MHYLQGLSEVCVKTFTWLHSAHRMTILMYHLDMSDDRDIILGELLLKIAHS
jgi:hypothetical protein